MPQPRRSPTSSDAPPSPKENDPGSDQHRPGSPIRDFSRPAEKHRPDSPGSRLQDSGSDRRSHERLSDRPEKEVAFTFQEASTSDQRTNPTDIAHGVLASPLRQEVGKKREIPIERGERIPITYMEPYSQYGMRDFAMQDVLDFSDHASDFHQAAVSKNTEMLYRTLYMLQREQGAVDQFLQTYQEKGYGSPHEVLTSLNSVQQEYARQLIGEGQPLSEQAIQATPSSQAEISQITERLHRALHNSPSVVPETLYAALTPLRRNTPLLRQLKEAYHSNYGQDLHNEITEKLSHQPAAHDFARFLLGDSVQEKQTMSKLEAQNIVAALSQQQFTAIRRINQPLREGGDPDQQANPDGSVARTRAFVPHTYLPDGCAGRTYIIKQTLKEMGYASQHVTLYSVDEHMKGNLTVKSIHYASDAPLGSEQNVRWRFHTAPIIKVSTAISERETHNEEYVIDLALTERQPRLLKETEWLHHLVSPTTNIEAIDSHQLEDILCAEEQARPGNNTANYPPGRTILFKLNIPLTELPTLAQLERAKIDPNTMAESSEDWFRTYEHRKLSNQTILEPYYQIAKIIRQEYQHGFHAQRFSQRMRSTPGALRHTFPNVFPQLYTSFKAHLASRGQGESVSHYFQPPPFGISSQTLTTITQKRKSPPVSDDE